MSADAERAFSACMLMLGKLCTQLSDESFCAGLLLCSWHKAGMLPELGGMVQCLKDGDVAMAVKTKQRQHPTDKDHVSGTLKKHCGKYLVVIYGGKPR